MCVRARVRVRVRGLCGDWLCGGLCGGDWPTLCRRVPSVTFEVHTIADPGSYTLGKSVTPYVVALMLRVTGDKLHTLQWVCIVLQCGCLVVAQYDPCKGVGAIPTRAYWLIALSTCITATCGVWNQKVRARGRTCRRECVPVAGRATMYLHRAGTHAAADANGCLDGCLRR